MQDEAVIAANQTAYDTERLTLRPMRTSDVGLIEMYSRDERVARMTASIPHPLPPGATEAYIARALSPKADHQAWVLDGSSGGLAEVLGVISLTPLDAEQSEIAYWVAPAFWNTGFASEALDGIVAANPQGMKTLFASVFQDNPASARVLTHCGFQYLGDAELYSVARDTTVPTWTYLRTLD